MQAQKEPPKSPFQVADQPEAVPFSSIIDTKASFGFGQSPAILIVDVQKYATDPESPVFALPIIPTLEPINRLSETAREKSVPVIYVTNVFDPNQPEVDCAVYLRKLSGYKLFMRGSRWAEIANEIKPKQGDIIIEKKMSSAFFQTNLTRILTTLRVDSVIVTGFATSGCFRATVVDALFNGYIPIVPEECVSDRSPAAHRQNLIDIGLRYCDILPLEQVLAYLRGLPNKKRSASL